MRPAELPRFAVCAWVPVLLATVAHAANAQPIEDAAKPPLAAPTTASDFTPATSQADARTLYLTTAARAGTGLGYSFSLGGMWFPNGLSGHNLGGTGLSLQTELGTRGFEVDLGYGGGIMGPPAWCPLFIFPGLAWSISSSMIYRGWSFEGAGESRSVLAGGLASLAFMYVDLRGGLYFDVETGSPLGTGAIGVGGLSQACAATPAAATAPSARPSKGKRLCLAQRPGSGTLGPIRCAPLRSPSLPFS